MQNLETYNPFEVDQHLTAHSTYYAGKLGSAFYITLRDDKKIMGVKCKACDKVLWPPRSTCGRCFSLLTEADLVEIGPSGVLQSFTMVMYDEPVMPKKAPFIFGIIKLDGADYGMTHFIGEAEYGQLKVGMRMQPVFKEKMVGNILDIDYFKLI